MYDHVSGDKDDCGVIMKIIVLTEMVKRWRWMVAVVKTDMVKLMQMLVVVVMWWW